MKRPDRIASETDAEEWLRVHLFGAENALAAAEAATSPLERALNRTVAARQLGLALRMLPPEALQQIAQEIAMNSPGSSAQ